MAVPMKRLSAGLFNSPTLSDVTIKQIDKGETREYHAHKAVLCMESRYFLKAFTGNFKEATDNVIALYDDDPDQFELLLKYIYTYQYNTNALDKRFARDKVMRVKFAVQLYGVADKYEVPNIYAAITEDVGNLLLAEKNDTFKLLNAAIHTYYQYTSKVDDPMGKMLVSFILKGHRAFIEAPDYIKVVTSQPFFGADMALALARDTINLRCFNCTAYSSIRRDVRNERGKGDTVYCSFCKKPLPVAHGV